MRARSQRHEVTRHVPRRRRPPHGRHSAANTNTPLLPTTRWRHTAPHTPPSCNSYAVGARVVHTTCPSDQTRHGNPHEHAARCQPERPSMAPTTNTPMCDPRTTVRNNGTHPPTHTTERRVSAGHTLAAHTVPSPEGGTTGGPRHGGAAHTNHTTRPMAHARARNPAATNRGRPTTNCQRVRPRTRSHAHAHTQSHRRARTHTRAQTHTHTRARAHKHTRTHCGHHAPLRMCRRTAATPTPTHNCGPEALTMATMQQRRTPRCAGRANATRGGGRARCDELHDRATVHGCKTCAVGLNARHGDKRHTNSHALAVCRRSYAQSSVGTCVHRQASAGFSRRPRVAICSSR